MPATVGNSPEWQPLANEFLDAAVSTALSVPIVPMSGNPPRPVPGAKLVAILLAQTVDIFYRTDADVVTNFVTGGIQLPAGSWVIIYGQVALKNIRVIRSSAGGSLAVSYYWYRDP